VVTVSSAFWPRKQQVFPLWKETMRKPKLPVIVTESGVSAKIRKVGNGFRPDPKPTNGQHVRAVCAGQP
jgi:hypothetical protein